MLCCFVHHNQGNTIFSVNSPMETASEWQSILLPLTVIFSRRIFSTVCSGSVPAIRISPRKRSPAPVKAIFRNVQFRMLPKPGGCFNSSEYFSQAQYGCHNGIFRGISVFSENISESIKIKTENSFHLKVNVCKFSRNKSRSGK